MLKASKICALALFALLALTARAQDADDMVLNHKTNTSAKLDLTNAPAAENPAQNETLSSQGSSNLRLAGLLFVMLGGCAGAGVLYIKRRRGASVAAGASPRLSIVERLPFGPNREFVLLKACDRMLVVAAQGNQIVCLTDMATDLAPITAAPEAPIQDFGEQAPLSYESLFSQVQRRAASGPQMPPPPKAPARHKSAAPVVAAPVPASRTQIPQDMDWPEVEGANK